MNKEESIIKKATEMGILLSLKGFVKGELKPGRLRTKLFDVETIANTELVHLADGGTTFFTKNKKAIGELAEKYHIMGEFETNKENIHVAQVAAFCMAFLENNKNVSDKLYPALSDIVDYYERVEITDKCVKFRDKWKNGAFQKKWDTYMVKLPMMFYSLQGKITKEP